MKDGAASPYQVHPALLAAFFFAFGVLFFRHAEVDLSIISAAAIAAAIILYRADAWMRGALILSLICGVVAIFVHDSRSLPQDHISRLAMDGKNSAVVEVLYTEAVRPRTARYVVKTKFINGAAAEGEARLVIRKGEIQFTPLPGDVIALFDVKFRKPRGFRNVGGFDYENYLNERDIYGDFFSSAKSRIVKVTEAPNMFRSVEAIKNTMRATLKSKNPEITALSWAILIGDDGLVTTDQRTDFSRAGTAHILSVSGLHVGFIAAACYFAAKIFVFLIAYAFKYRWASAGVPMRVGAFFALVAAAFYCALAGFKFPVMRSFIMAAVYLTAVMAGRGRNFYGALGVALLIILAAYPWSLFDVSFQLSFGAVFAIAVFMEKWWKPLFDVEPLEEIAPSWKTWLLKKYPALFSYVAVSVFATIGTAPLVAHHFNSVPVYGFFVNAVVVPVSSLAVPWGMLWSMGGPGWALAATETMMELTGFLTSWAASLPMSYKSVTEFHPAAAAFYYAGFTALLMMKKGKVRLASFAMCVACAVTALMWIPYKRSGDKNLTVRFVDIGQGDCTIALWPENGALIIDGGPRFEMFDPGRGVVAPLLLRSGRSELSAMIATHEDADHLGGLAGVAMNVPPKMFYDNGTESGAMVDVRNKAKRFGGYKELSAGEELNFPGGLRAIVLSPPDGELPFPDVVNNKSLAVMLKYGKTRVLTVGDMGKEAEKWLVESGVDIKADVLKIAHHGSNTSSSREFLEAVGAKTAVISVGYMNRHRHPSAKVLERLRVAGIRVFRTDLDGEVILKTDGEKINITTWQMISNAR